MISRDSVLKLAIRSSASSSAVMARMPTRPPMTAPSSSCNGPTAHEYVVCGSGDQSIVGAEVRSPFNASTQ